MEETQKLVNTIIDGIQEKKGRGIVTVDLRNIITAPSSYFVICTGGSPQQVDAITDSVEEFARKQAGEKPAAAAGYKPAPQLGRQIAVYQEVIKKLANKCWQAF